MRRSILLAFLILLGPAASVNASFPPQNVNPAPVGWDLGNSQAFGDFRISYPGMTDGRRVDMATNGPFAVVVFFPDNGEDVEQYLWLQDSLASSGYISFVVDASQDDWGLIEERLLALNDGLGPINGTAGMLAMEYIALAGHGTGAHTAAELVRSGDHTFSALFGLGLDGSESEHTEGMAILARPSSALFLTGTTDDIAPASDEVMNYLQGWPGAWQVMHQLGGNHIQFQEETTFLERLLDGDGNMSEQEQRDHAVAHILPYLNLSLRGDDTAYQAAFNRENKESSGDVYAYIDEDLNRSRLYQLDDTHPSLNSVQLGDNFTLFSAVTMRDGTPAIGNVSCRTFTGELFIGQLENGIASCELNGDDLLPGMQVIELHIGDHSFSDWSEALITRIDTPMVVVSPLPDVMIQQHSNASMQTSALATDPDGLDIHLGFAEIAGDNGRLNLSWDANSFTISHVADQEWSGTVLLDLILMAGIDDQANITLRVVVSAVDDPVVQIETVPQQRVDEDGETIIVDMAQYVSDPEDSTLETSPVMEYDGLRIVTGGAAVLIDPLPNWNGAEIVEVFVSDGSTSPITISIPVVVDAIDDPLELIGDWTLSFDEDDTLTIPISELVLDVDGDDLQYSLNGSSELLAVTLSGHSLIIAGHPNEHGFSQEYSLLVDDGNSNISGTLSITIEPVVDLPMISITSLSAREGQVSMLWVIDDADGLSGLIHNITYDGDLINHQTECTGERYITCSTVYKHPANHTGWKRIEIRVWDTYGQEWSNMAFQNVEIEEPKPIVEDKSGGEMPQWVLPVGLGVIILLLFGVFRQGKTREDNS
jgi:hypothetical protein